MKRAIALMVTLTACSAGDPPLFVVGVLAPPVPDASSTCLFDASPTGPFLGSGVMDRTLASEYSAVLLVGDQSLAHSTCSRACGEDIAIIDSAHVVDFDPDSTLLDDFTEATTAFVQPPSGSSPGFGTLALTLVSSRAASSAGKRVLASVRLSGLLHGSRVETDAVTFPIDVCAGCLVSCPSSGACVVGQDQPICR